MGKKNIISIVLLGVLAVGLLTLYLLLRDNGSRIPEPEKPSYIVITKLPVETIDRIGLKSGNFDGEFTLEQGTWVRTGEEVFPVKQTAIKSIISIVAANLNAFEKVQNPAGIAEYGLDAPSAVLKLYAGNSLLLELLVGNKLPTTNRYYVKVSGDDSIYICSENYYNYLVHDRADLLETITLPKIADRTQLREVEILNGSETVFHAIYDESNPYDYSTNNMFPWYFLEPLSGHVNAGFNADGWYTKEQRYLQVTYSKLVAFRPADYKRYGLTDDCTKIIVHYTDENKGTLQSYTLIIGASAGDGTSYAKLLDSDWVFAIEDAVANSWRQVNLFPCIYQTALFPGVNLMETITIQTPSEQWVIKNMHVDEEHTICSLNDRRLTTDELNDLSVEIMRLKYSGLSTGEEMGDEVMTISVAVSDDVHKDTCISFYRCNDSVYLVSVDGGADFTMDVRDVNSFLSYMRSFR